MSPQQIEVPEVLHTHPDGFVLFRELGDLELALVGGGCGDVALA